MAEPATTVLVTGATGFVGKRVTAHLVREGVGVRVLVRPASRQRADVADGVTVADGDVRDAVAVAEAARGCTAVIHLVGILRERGSRTYQAIHVEGTANVVSACRSRGVRRLVHMSALGVGRGTETGYFRTKEAAEQHVRDSGLDWTIVRPSVIHGPRGDFMIQMARMVARFGPVPLVGRGDQVVQPVWVEDVARVFVAALGRDATIGHACDVGGPDVLTLRQFYRILSRVLLGREKRLMPVPTFAVRAGAWLAAHLLSNPPVAPDEVRMLLAARPCDIGPMTEAFGVEPAPFEQTLASYADELKAGAGLA